MFQAGSSTQTTTLPSTSSGSNTLNPPNNQRPKRIVILCDGTGNNEGNPALLYTNVSRIKRYVKAQTVDGTHQMCLYIEGIGTEGSTADKKHQMKAQGIEARIKRAYTIICNNYSHPDDQILLIGFSRGAFELRCVADLVGRIGLLTNYGSHHMDIVFKKWETCKGEVFPYVDSDAVQNELEAADSWDDDIDPKRTDLIFANLLRDRRYLRRRVRIQVCALWDTVAALGSKVLGFGKVPVPEKFAFVNSDLSENIGCAIQALSLHERRKPWLPLVWRLPLTSPLQLEASRKLQQCWFVGYHSNIGGGTASQGLSQISLAWMIARLQPFLEFDINKFGSPPPTLSSWNLTTGSIIAPDSKKKRYFTAGEKHRHPRRQFWTTTVFEENPTPPTDNDTMRSKEAIHWTVDVLTERGALPPCKALESAVRPGPMTNNCQCDQGDRKHRRQWNLQNYRVCEERPGYQTPRVDANRVDANLELALLNKWLDSELKALQKRTRDGDERVPEPGTFIAEVKAAITTRFMGTLPAAAPRLGQGRA